MTYTNTIERSITHMVGDTFTGLVLESDVLNHIKKDNWWVGPEKTKEIEETQISQEVVASLSGHDPDGMDDSGLQQIFWDGDNLLYLRLSNGSIQLQVASPSVALALKVITDWREKYPPKEPEPEDKQTKVTFWAATRNGPTNFTRVIDVPNWDDISVNYSNKIRNDLAELMKVESGEFFSDGQLVLWQGPPGTGKTTALRALAHSWLKWCDMYYITDPDQFFQSPDYLMNVLFSNNDGPYANANKESKYKLLVLEDAGELLRPDAKDRVGQALGRLLNTVDGMIGQGLKVLVLITTNEELQALHEAIQRPGRCASQLSFDELTGGEMEAWAIENGVNFDDLPQGRATLAELYAAKAGRKSKEVKTFGFATNGAH